ncbi:MAG: MerR family transcriptional regulator [Candidatus Omnitrophica bacterium]|nr:MerR family transcriptional regulator [Candidatus Omnitrophota bacterium]
MRLTIKGKKYFTATQVAATLGISKQTLLRYEARGLFPKATRNQLNRWREYTENDIQTLRKIMGR